MDSRITLNAPKTVGQMQAVYFKGRYQGEIGTFSGKYVVVGLPCGTHDSAESAAEALCRYNGKIK